MEDSTADEHSEDNGSSVDVASSAADGTQSSPPRAAEGAAEVDSASSSETNFSDPVRIELHTLACVQISLYTCIRYIPFLQVLLLKQCTVLGGLTEDKWTDTHYTNLRLFLEDSTLPILLLYLDSTTEELCIVDRIPPLQVPQASYFLRRENVAVTGSNFHRVLQMGTLQGSYVATLLRVMQGLYAPNFFENKLWPDSIHYVL